MQLTKTTLRTPNIAMTTFALNDEGDGEDQWHSVHNDFYHALAHAFIIFLITIASDTQNNNVESNHISTRETLRKKKKHVVVLWLALTFAFWSLIWL